MRRQFKNMPMTFDAEQVPDRYYTKQEWAEVKRLIREDGVDKHDALKQVVATRVTSETVISDEGPLTDPTD